MERKFTFFVEPELEIENADESEDGGSEGEGSEDCMTDGAEGEGRHLIVRLDKWLWAARFFKTRALARAAVEAGKVFYNGERSKPSREIEVGAILQVRQGRFEKTVIVKGLSTRRRSTDEALQLFEETEESKSFREQQSADVSEQDHRNHRYQNHHSHSHGHSHSYHQPGFAAETHSYDQKPAGLLRRPFGRSENFQHSQSQHSQHIRNESRSPYRNPRSQTQYPTQYPNQSQSQNQYPNHNHNQNQYPNHRNSNYSNPYSRQQNTNYAQPYYPNQGSNHGNSGNASNPYNGNQPYYPSGQSGYPNSNYNSGYQPHHHQSHNQYHHQNGHSHSGHSGHSGHAGYNPRHHNHNPNHSNHHSNPYPNNRSHTHTQNRQSIPNDNMEPQTESD